jgi:hypothetical protein
MPTHNTQTQTKEKAKGKVAGKAMSKAAIAAARKNAGEVDDFHDMVSATCAEAAAAVHAQTKKLRQQEQTALATKARIAAELQGLDAEVKKLAAATYAGGTIALRATAEEACVAAKEARARLLDVSRTVETVRGEIETLENGIIGTFRDRLLERQDKEGIYLGRVQPGGGSGRLAIMSQQVYMDSAGRPYPSITPVPVKKTIMLRGNPNTKAGNACVALPGSYVVVSGGFVAGAIGPGVARELEAMYTYLCIKTQKGVGVGEVKTDFFDDKNGAGGIEFDHSEEAAAELAAGAAAKAAVGGGHTKVKEVLLEDL